MKTKIIDIRTSINGEINDTLCINNATPAQLNGILALSGNGFEILLTVRDQDIPVPNFNDDEE